MSRKYDGPSFIVQCFYGEEDQKSDDCRGYRRLEPTEQKSSKTSGKHATNVHGSSRQCANSYHTPDSRSRTVKKSDAYTKVDAKGKRLSNTLRRKEVRKRVGHALHSTWKWVKRGALAAAPTMASMFMFSPAPAFTFATTTSRRS